MVEPPQEENGRGEVSNMHVQFFDVTDGDGCWEGNGGLDGGVGTSRCLWVLGRGGKRFGGDWLGLGQEMRVHRFGRWIRHGFVDHCFQNFLPHSTLRTKPVKAAFLMLS